VDLIFILVAIAFIVFKDLMHLIVILYGQETWQIMAYPPKQYSSSYALMKDTGRVAPQSWSGCCGKEKNLLSLLGTEA
jgi:hypothetical protein